MERLATMIADYRTNKKVNENRKRVQLQKQRNENILFALKQLNLAELQNERNENILFALEDCDAKNQSIAFTVMTRSHYEMFKYHLFENKRRKEMNLTTYEFFNSSKRVGFNQYFVRLDKRII